jgi:4-hydroxy-tetrahydrodipicolinate synthase
LEEKQLTTLCMTPTPFHEDGSIDEAAMREHLRRLVAARTGLFLCSGGAGEAHVLGPDELRRIYAIGVEEGKGKVPVFAGLRESRSAAAMYEVARAAVDAGVDAVQLYQLDNGHGMIPTPREQEAYWRELLEAIDAPVVISIHYDAKFKPGTRLLQDLVARYKQIRGLALVGSQASYFIELRDAIPRPVKFYCGVPEFMQHSTLGGAGYINPAGNLMPYVCRSLIDAWEAGDLKQVAKSNEAVQRFLRIVNQWAPSTARWVKMGLKVRGLGNGVLRLPYLLPAEEEQRKMADQFAALRIDALEEEAAEYVRAHA